MKHWTFVILLLSKFTQMGISLIWFTNFAVNVHLRQRRELIERIFPRMFDRHFVRRIVSQNFVWTKVPSKDLEPRRRLGEVRVTDKSRVTLKLEHVWSETPFQIVSLITPFTGRVFNIPHGWQTVHGTAKAADAFPKSVRFEIRRGTHLPKPLSLSPEWNIPKGVKTKGSSRYISRLRSVGRKERERERKR